MRSLFMLQLGTAFIFFSCSSNERSQPNTPSTFNQANSGSVYKKRGYQDVVEGLYDEVVEKSQELQSMEQAIQALHDSKDDSLSTFQTFQTNNNKYYSSAQQHLARIKDSLLRTRVKAAIDNSLARYEASIKGHKDLVQIVHQKEAFLNDLHSALKITQTLPVIEEYQKKNTPSLKPIQGLRKQLDEVINRTERVMKDSIK